MNGYEDESARGAGVGATGHPAAAARADYLPQAVPGAAPAPEPLPWRRMSRAECMQLAVALERALAARRVSASR